MLCSLFNNKSIFTEYIHQLISTTEKKKYYRFTCKKKVYVHSSSTLWHVHINSHHHPMFESNFYVIDFVTCSNFFLLKILTLSVCLFYLFLLLSFFFFFRCAEFRSTVCNTSINFNTHTHQSLILFGRHNKLNFFKSMKVMHFQVVNTQSNIHINSVQTTMQQLTSA